MSGDNGYHSERRGDLKIMDVTPTVLDRMGIDIPWHMEGKVIQ
jgi:bisphosphoglycerate-independent phosphoglycerate mutase (AlkP superfamily)